MPELPEVEFCRRSLARWTEGRRVVAAEVWDGRSVRGDHRDRPSAGLADGAATLDALVRAAPPGPILRHGKRLLWRFGDRALLLHLGMTGKWTRRGSPHRKVGLRLDDGSEIVFADPRLLGGVVPTTWEAGQEQVRAGHGPDAWDEPLPELRGRRAVKVALMDQSVVAGLGNLHAAEALWRARIHPATPAEEVRGDAHTRLEAGVRAQLAATFALFGQDDEIVYVEEDASTNPFPIYARGGAPCPACGTPIAKMVQGGRTTWWCPSCQGP